MRKIFYSLLLIGFTTLTFAQVERANMLIRGGTVLTITKGTFELTDILVKDGRISEIGKNISAPSGFPVVDATGDRKSVV